MHEAAARMVLQRALGWRRSRLTRTGRGTLPVIILLVAAASILVIGILAPVVSPHDPIKLDMRRALQPPSADAWFGTDDTGRDILSRVIWGTRLSLVSATGVLAIAVLIGVVLGAVSGYGSASIDQIIMRMTDLFLAFPGLVLAMAIAAALGPSLEKAVVASGIVWWPVYARMLRGQVLSVKEHSYVEAARAQGATAFRVLFKHVLPQCWGVLMVRVTVDVGYAILLTASLSFLGLGGKDPTPEWGIMIATSRSYFLAYWWTATFPGLAMFITVVVFSLLGDALYERIDPGIARQRVLN